MSRDFSITLSHIGYFITDSDKMVDFYTRFMRFVVSDCGGRGDGSAISLKAHEARRANIEKKIVVTLH